MNTLSYIHSHVNTNLKEGYSKLRTLKLLKRYTPYHLRKQRVINIIQKITTVSKK